MNEFKKNIFSAKFEDILGAEDTKKQVKSALLMNRHILIMGPPGVGKTTFAKNVAKLLPEIEVNECEYNCDPKNPLCPKCRTQKVNTKKIMGEERFVRVQGSPDLTVEDLLGDIDPIKAMEFGALSIEAFTPGKIFKANNGVLFFDEVNRSPEKLQNALLQVLEEGKATLGSYTVDLPANFILIATMNPQDSSTETLSEVFLDRFDLVYMGYPDSLEIEQNIVLEKGEKLDIEFPEKLLLFIIKFVRELRENKDIEKKPSVRATLGLYERSQANAMIEGRKKVEFQDIKNCIISVLSHRFELKPSVKYLKSTEEFISEHFAQFSKEEDLGDIP